MYRKQRVIMIYLDNAATTKASQAAIDSMIKYAGEDFYNPSAGYAPALAVKKALGKATAISLFLPANRRRYTNARRG